MTIYLFIIVVDRAPQEHQGVEERQVQPHPGRPPGPCAVPGGDGGWPDPVRLWWVDGM